jgi:hypothetical protein
MIDDGAKEHGRDDVIVQDISMHLVDALEGRGSRPRQADVEADTGVSGGVIF